MSKVCAHCGNDCRSPGHMAWQRGLGLRCYMKLMRRGQLNKYPVTISPYIVNCLVCNKRAEIKKYCREHYYKFVSALRRRLNPVCIRCLIAPQRGRRLCNSCYSYVKRHDLFHQYPLVHLRERYLCSKSMLEQICKMANLSEHYQLITYRIWCQHDTETKAESSERQFERVKKRIRELQLPYESTPMGFRLEIGENEVLKRLIKRERV